MMRRNPIPTSSRVRLSRQDRARALRVEVRHRVRAMRKLLANAASLEAE